MERREFIQRGIAAGTLLMMPVGLTPFAFGAEAPLAGPPDLVGLVGGTPQQMLEKGLAAIGGMGRFVKKDQTVLVKPNIGWNKKPEEGANTNPELVGAVIKEVLKAGAKQVYVFDNTCNHWQHCYQNSGIEAAVTAAGGTMIPGNDQSKYRRMDVKGATTLKTVDVHELFLDSDVVINLPVLKHHGGARMTCALKNMMGVIWDRHFWHRTDLQQCIGEFSVVRKPDLCIADANTVMVRNGPRGVSVADLELRKMQIISTDPVAVDAAGAKILGREASDIPYIGIASKLGMGIDDLSTLKVERITF